MKKFYYVYIKNLYFDSFDRSHKLELNKIINDDDIIQTYKKNNTIFIQLDYNEKIERYINNMLFLPKTKNKYQKQKEKARQWVINKSYEISEKNLSWYEEAELESHLEKIAKKYGLIKEFKKNGLL